MYDQRERTRDQTTQRGVGTAWPDLQSGTPTRLAPCNLGASEPRRLSGPARRSLRTSAPRSGDSGWVSSFECTLRDDARSSRARRQPTGGPYWRCPANQASPGFSPGSDGRASSTLGEPPVRRRCPFAGRRPSERTFEHPAADQTGDCLRSPSYGHDVHIHPLAVDAEAIRCSDLIQSALHFEGEQHGRRWEGAER